MDYYITYFQNVRYLTEECIEIDFNGYLIPELNRIAEEVRKITHYKGEPKIVLLVHEKPDNPCSERLGLVKLFAEHGIELKEWTKDRSGLIF